jgi:hypothetical protein
MSASPGRAPQVTHRHEVGSPVRSVRPGFLLESLNSQAEFGPRTFLDNPSPDEETHVPNIPDTHTSPQGDDSHAERPFSRQRRSGHYLGGTTEQFQSNCAPERKMSRTPSPRSPVEPTDFERYQQLTREACKSGFDSDEDSYIGSVEEMTPVRPARRSNMLVDGLFNHTSPHVLEEESPILPKVQDLAMARQIKEVHHLTMQALTGISGSSNPPPTPPPIPTRDSRYQDWRNSKDIDQSRRLRRKSLWRHHLSIHRGCPYNNHISKHPTLSAPSTAKSLAVNSQPRNLHCAALVCMTAYSLSASVAAIPTVGYDSLHSPSQPTASSVQSKIAVAVPTVEAKNTHLKTLTTQNCSANYDAVTKAYWDPGATSQLEA